MKKFFVLLGTLAVAALFFSCANSSDGNSAALLGLQNTATKTTVSKTIKIGGVEYSYTIVDGQPQASGGVSVAEDGTVTITAADGSKVAVKGETITYTTADSKVYVGSGSSGGITLVNKANPNDKITAAVTSQTKTESAQQGGTDELPKRPWLKAEAVDGGIKFTIKALGSRYNNEGDCFIYSQSPSDIGRFYPEWNDKTKEWTGVYPYVSAGVKYTFRFHVKDLQEEAVSVTATGGVGQIQYDANCASSIAVDDKAITVFADKFPPSVIPNGVTNKKVLVGFLAGEGWVASRQIWDGEYIDCLEKYEADFVQPDASGNCVYKIANTDALYTKLKKAMTGTYSGKKMFIEFTYRYKVDGLAAECHSRQLRSAPILPEWTAPQNESANFKAETVSGGVKLTIKAPQDPNKYTDVLQIMIHNPSGNEIGWIYPDWQDKSQAWTGVYPLVDDGKTYRFIFQPNGGLPNETVKCKTGSGCSGEIQYGTWNGMNPFSHLSLFQYNTSVSAFIFPPSLIPASATEKKAYMVYYAGTGWNADTQTWDGNLVLERRETSLAESKQYSSDSMPQCSYMISSSDPDFDTIKNAMKTTYPTKKMFVQFGYEFKLAGINGACYTRIMNSEPADASELRK